MQETKAWLTRCISGARTRATGNKSAFFDKADYIWHARASKAAVKSIATFINLRIGVNAKLLNVVTTKFGLPGSTFKQIEAAGAEGQIKTVFDRGKIHIAGASAKGIEVNRHGQGGQSKSLSGLTSTLPF